MSVGDSQEPLAGPLTCAAGDESIRDCCKSTRCLYQKSKLAIHAIGVNCTFTRIHSRHSLNHAAEILICSDWNLQALREDKGRCHRDIPEKLLKAVKRLMKEAAELKDPTDHYHAQPLEDNLFEWHFTVRGPPDSDFDGGVYHGRIVLPPEYPMKPPSIILLTLQNIANGRFEVGKKICLSISGHHPETWQPSWSIRTALLAIIGFMPTKGEGAIGSLDYTPEERRALAKKCVENSTTFGKTKNTHQSQDFCCEGCGSAMKDVLLPLKSGSDSSQADQEAKELARQIRLFSCVKNGVQNSSAASFQQPTQPVAKNTSMSPRQRRAQQQSQRRSSTSPDVIQGHQPRDNHTDHGGSAVLIVILTLALAALVFRRIYLANEYIFDFEL
ncbi:Ubiquitin-conjugating enzyme E2 J1 [Saguinus oedipus]|uniref:Ubiquitin-conjugating enzyme E2 J1 n=1 Tax=Saguinus oedipus TaxID=9490 RepID=A0ABQ9VXD4_SAGOE|nr:Ubiquitin-conjugating enzyme E2 J1 [Saguinus oedipus]